MGLAASLVAVPTARADDITFTSNISTGNSALSGYTSPFVGVSVDLTSSTTAAITFTGDLVSGNQYLMGDSSAVDLNVNASSFTATSFTDTNAGTGFTPGPLSNGGSGTVDGFGTFNLTINSFDGFTHTGDTITFLLTDTSGTWASAADVLIANGLGWDAAAHIYVTSSPANASNGAAVTGFAAEAGTSNVPEPSTLILLGSELLALGGFFRRRWLGFRS